MFTFVLSHRAPILDVSLFDSGKSRADLWAFATIVAVEFGVETNNAVCDGSYKYYVMGGSNGNKNAFAQCNEDVGEAKCKVNYPRQFKFETGRRDCSNFGDLTYKGWFCN